MDIVSNYILSRLGSRKDDDVVGVLVYGSYSIGNADDLSDIDVAVILGSGKEYFEYLELEKDLDIAYIPIRRLEEVVEESFNRSNHSLWLTHSLYLKILSTGKIIYDPQDLLARYQERIRHWKWMQEDIKNAVEQLHEIIEYAIEEYSSNNILEATILLGDAINLYIIIKEMKNNKIPSPQSKDLFDSAKKYGLLNQYTTVHRLRHINEKTVLKVIDFLWRKNDPFIRRNLKSMKRLLIRREKNKALLVVRKSFFGVIDQRMRAIINMYNPQLKIKILENLDDSMKQFLGSLYNQTE